MRVGELFALLKKVKPRANIVDPTTGRNLISIEHERREKRAFYEGFEKEAGALDPVRDVIRNHPLKSVLGPSFLAAVLTGNKLKSLHRKKQNEAVGQAYSRGFQAGTNYTPEEQARDEVARNKYAASTSLIGTMKGLKPGITKYEEGGDLNRAPAGPNPGVAVAPKSDMPPLPTMVKQNPANNLSASLPFKRVKIPKPPNR